MTQIVVTLDKDADPGFLRKIIENIRGVAKTSVKTKIESAPGPKGKRPLAVSEKYTGELSEEKKKWLEELDALCRNVDRSVIDLNDERTRYILSK